MKKAFAIRQFTFLVFLSAPILGFSQTDPTPTPTVNLGQQSIMALDWYQTSGERRAICYEAYQLAKMILEQKLGDPQSHGLDPAKKNAVIMDIDETVLDNTPEDAGAALTNAPYDPDTFNEWVKTEQSTAIPGAVPFLNYAVSHEVTVFYITNRSNDPDTVAHTLSNLAKLGFPEADAKHLMAAAASDKGDKEGRRNIVRKDYNVLLYIGDNLNDLGGEFWKKTAEQRKDLVDQEQARFGDDYITIPNPIYGDWESSLYIGKTDDSPSDTQQIREDALTSWTPSDAPAKLDP